MKGAGEMRIDRIKFRTELLKQEITQTQLAKQVGVTRATINNIACGKSCRDDVACKIAKILGVDISEIIQQ